MEPYYIIKFNIEDKMSYNLNISFLEGMMIDIWG